MRVFYYNRTINFNQIVLDIYANLCHCLKCLFNLKHQYLFECFSMILNPITSLSLILLCTKYEKQPHENEVIGIGEEYNEQYSDTVFLFDLRS
jgi:branched-subunit amino acid permease